MPAFAFDTLKASDALIAAGIDAMHARAITETMRDAVTEGVATKADIAEVKADIGKLESGIAEVKADIGKLESDIGKLESGLAEVKTDIGKLESDIGKLEAKMESENAKLESRLTARIEAATGALKSRIDTMQWAMGFLATMQLLMAGRMFGVF